MAVNYADLFENIGEYVQRINDFAAIIAALDTDFAEIAADLETNGRFDVLEGEYDQFEQYKSQVLTWISQCQAKITELLTHKSTMLDELVYGSDTSFQAVITALYLAMANASESLTANSVSLGTVTLTAVGSSDGVMVVDKVMDGVTAPSTGYSPVLGYKGVNSELALTDEMAATCTTDSVTNGVADGSESFHWAGRPASGDVYSGQTYGSGDGPSLRPIQVGSILSNAEFTSFTVTNTPDSWTIATGTVGTHILEDATAFRGTKALELTGNGALAEIKLYQGVTQLTSNKRYLVGFWVRGQAGTSAGTLTIQFEGTGYAAGSTEKITMNAAALAAQTSYGFEYFWVNVPAEIPTDFALVVKWSGTPSAHSVLINGGGMREAVYFNGHCAAITAGSSPFLRTDRFAYTVTNDYAGVFQAAFAKSFGIQLPSSGSPTRADSLAT